MPPVSSVPPADSAVALAHFSASLSFETDCADVHAALESDDPRSVDFVLLDVRSAAHFSRGHVPGATNILHGKIVASRLAGYRPARFSSPIVRALTATEQRAPQSGSPNLAAR